MEQVKLVVDAETTREKLGTATAASVDTATGVWRRMTIDVVVVVVVVGREEVEMRRSLVDNPAVDLTRNRTEILVERPQLASD